MIHTIDLHFQHSDETIAAFLYETSEGPILIETGPHSTIEHLEKGIQGSGYKLSDIKHVFITHIHLDHAGAAWYFAKQGAKIYVHPVGYPHLLDPSRLIHSAKRIYQDQMDSLWGKMEAIDSNQLIEVKDKSIYIVGNTEIKAWYTPGHAIHHIAWQIEDQLFSGDVGGVKIGDGIIVPPCPPPDINIEDWQESIRLIKSLDLKTMHLTHFGAIHNIHEHLDKLELILLDWANWIKPFYDKQASPEEVTPLFEKYVASQLEKADIKGLDLIRYAKANPPWMSVAGLMRYWRKKV